MGSRGNSPVFVMGCPRSGTTLFYHMLLSAGDFAVYRTEAYVFNMLVPRFGNLKRRRNREELLRHWLPSEKFRRSGLPAEEFGRKVHAECRSGGDLLRLLMESIAQKQGVRRWAECTPENLLYISEIKKAFPEALLIHMIRDGRDVALSLEKQHWIRPLPSDRRRAVMAAGLFWEWIIGKGRSNAVPYAKDYLEVRYEDVVERPRETLAGLASFIEHDLDYDRIRKVGIGSVTEPNTSFRAETQGGIFAPVGRWTSGFTEQELTEFELLVGKLIAELGYPLATVKGQDRAGGTLRRLRGLYRTWFESKLLLKTRTPLGRYLVNTALLQDAHTFDQDRLMPETAGK